MKPRAFIFDAYGTLFNVHSFVLRCDYIPRDLWALAALWWEKQLEYTWLRSLMERYEDSGRSQAPPCVHPSTSYESKRTKPSSTESCRGTIYGDISRRAAGARVSSRSAVSNQRLHQDAAARGSE